VVGSLIGGREFLDGDVHHQAQGSFGFRLGESQNIRLAYARNDTRTDVGADTDSFFVFWVILLGAKESLR
jgi:hypothetical protein